MSGPGPDELPAAGVAPEEAIAFFRSKGFRIGFSWLDIFKAEHVRWFTVAKAMSRDLLEDIRAEVDRAIAEGTTLADFQKALRPRLEARGWWGRKTMLDPQTGRHKRVQLGSPRRLKTIFNTNLRTAYAAGKWERIQRTKAALPFIEYSSMMDGRERPQHHAWNGTILPVDDPWWDTHYPPCDWNCRCSPIQRSQRMLDRQGKTVTAEPARFPEKPWVNERTGETGMLEQGIGRGWDYNVGKEYLRGLAPKPIPERFDGPDEVGAALQLTPSEARRIDRFLGHFGIDSGKEAIWMDRDGWPLSIGRGWFIAQGGAPQLRGADGLAIDRIAGAIVEPDSIDWVWVKAVDGRALLMRRYLRAEHGLATIVYVGGEGWFWRTQPAGEVAAAYDARQPRDKRGRWTSSGRGAFVAALDDRSLPNPRALHIGEANDATAASLAAIGVPMRGRWIFADGSNSRHILDRHGAGVELAEGERPIAKRHILAAHHAINNAQHFERGYPPKTEDGAPIVRSVWKSGRTETSVVFAVPKRGIVIQTMYRHVIDANGDRVAPRETRGQRRLRRTGKSPA